MRGAGYPIKITEPSEIVPRLLPMMQVGMRAMSLYNGVAGVPQTGVRKNTDGAADTTPASSQEQNADVKEALMNAQELLAKANGGNSGTCSGSCNCVIA